MTKRNKYIILTIICIFSIILLQALSQPQPSLRKEINFIPDEQTLLESPYAPLFMILILFYLALIVTGIANLVLFIGRKLSKKPLVTIQEKTIEFPLLEEKASKLMFLISLFVLLIYIIEFSISAFLATSFTKTPFINLAILLNLALEITVIITILKFIKQDFLIFRIKKSHLTALLRIYTAMLPLILGALLLNNFLLEKTNTPPSLNPAIEAILFLKNKFSILLIVSQVIAVGPVAEELLFRGFFYKFLRTKYSFGISAILISILFAFIHGTPQDTLPLFIISMMLCYVYEKTQNILAPIIFHSIHNTLSISILLTLKNLI
ncbi:MAG: CPBP family intramembrane metalloprotease [Candidatus Omnitrophota bacterium]|nr:MAG: CPBP family intramembrane metalloprotease [Candidatus Omnitrophota bacterium]